ncbi:MAG: flavin monoamine oxidase family protein [Nocardioidaceae bacterium]
MVPTGSVNGDGLSRRGLLGGMAAGGVGVLTGTLGGGLPGAEPAQAASLQGDLPARVDVVVVGGGIAGLVTASRVAARGRSVLVLEARDRVGGRVLNHPLRNGAVVESGGAFVGPTQDHILRLAKELGVATFKEYVDGSNVYVSHHAGVEQKTQYTGTIPPDPLILPDAAQLQTRIDQMATQVPVDAPWTAADAVTWDSTSLDTWLRSNTVNPEVRNLLLCYLQPAFGSDALDMSLLFFLWYIATAGDEKNPGTFERSAGTADGAQDSRFVGGSQRVPLRVAARLGDAVALNAPVRRIRQEPDQVVVTSDRGQVRAARVVVACPPPTVLGIEWQPGLPPRRQALLERMPMGALMKCDAVYETPFWRANGLSGMGLNDTGAVRVCFDNTPSDGSVGALLAFVGGSTWATYGTMSRAARRKAVLEGFAAVVGDEALHPIEYVEHDWTHEQWTKGGPVALQVPGAITAYGDTIRTPFRRVHWAGTETSTYWAGYMDGAVRSGERAAREVLDRL